VGAGSLPFEYGQLLSKYENLITRLARDRRAPASAKTKDERIPDAIGKVTRLIAAVTRESAPRIE
jgi:hypothetical protein